ncbi:hypothetical protein FE257_011421 [Aspergillus nanangensis]|uniref:Carrier domain-containing protein n=1 Tax=Aspergillus nanangensis TaxID=2582783 RepID=A0AAD4GQN1_ASPNN|nr:hypothetical protein FE257_011421 [Aspergillus nanangensis]
MGSIGVEPFHHGESAIPHPKVKTAATQPASAIKEPHTRGGKGGVAHRSADGDTPVNEPTMVPIAIVGMAARLPGNIRSTDDLWDVLLSQKDLSCEIPKDRYNIDAFYSDTHTRTVKARRGFFLSDDLADADPSVFGMGNVEAAQMDPQQRLLMEVVWECMENAGQVNWQGKDIGFYIGTFGDDWLEMSLRDPMSLSRLHIFNSNDFALSNRVSYQYDLRGPSMTIKTGCSASMVGLHEACQSVASQECSSAIVAGTSLIMTPTMTTCMSENMVLSPDGACKTFDAEANGFARGEAVNAVYIKRLDRALEDGDPIRAVIRATTTNSDGRTRKLAVPSADAQEALIRKAYERAGIADPSRTGLFECHGTGTAAGDVAETAAIANVFGEKGIHIGAVKPNVGHSEGASALTSIIKAVLSLERQAIAPNFRFKTPNPKIPFKEANLMVPQKLTPWPDDRDERVSVNSFGIGGANAHVILESARSYHAKAVNGRSRHAEEVSKKLVVVSACSSNSLKGRIESLSKYCRDGKVVTQDLAHTLGARRDHGQHRGFAVIKGAEILSELPEFQSGQAPAASPESLIFVFTGQGSQWHGMGKELLAAFASFRADIQRLDEVLQGLPTPPPWRMEEKLSNVDDDTSSCLQAEFAQPLCTAIQIGLVNLLASWGVHPTGVIGHSSGEAAAAYAAQAITAEAAIITAYCRGQATKSHSKLGGMVAIGMSRDAVTPYLNKDVAVACENSPQSVVISGLSDALTKVLDRITDEQPDTYITRLGVETAYHSHHMVEVGHAFEAMVQGLAPCSAPTIPFYSTVYGRVLNESDRLDGRYWRENLESTVLFSTAVKAALEAIGSKSSCFVEVGPHCPLSGPLRQIFREKKPKSPPLYASTLHKDQDQALNMFQSAGQLFLNGVQISLSAVNGLGEVLTDLPPYPWDYSAKRFTENRISKGWRQRPYPHHEILGSRVLESNDQEPCWRNIVRFENSPWISDHKLSGCIVFPAAGYIAMVGEAIRQITGVDGYSIRNMFIRNAMLFDQDDDVEVMTALRPVRLTDVLDSDWYDFTIYSYDGSEWRKHCTGQAAAAPNPLPSDRVESFLRPVDPTIWYRVLKRAGLEFGPHFQGLEAVTADPNDQKAAATLISREDLGKNDAYAIHPTLIDKTLQVMSVAVARGMTCDLDRIAVPIGVENIEIRQCGHRQLSAQASCRNAADGNFAGDAVAVHNGEMVLDIKGVRCFAMDRDSIQNDRFYATWSARADWKPHIEFRQSMQELFPPPPARMLDAFCLLEQATCLVILKMYRLTKDIPTTVPHMVKYKGWLKARVDQFTAGEYSIVPQAQQWVSLDATSQEQMLADKIRELNGLGTGVTFFGDFVQRLSDNVIAMVGGETTALEILMEKDGLKQFYDQMTWPEDYDRYLTSMGHANSELRVLEVGAGTGAITEVALQRLETPEGGRLFSEYVFSDISQGFFTAAKERFSEQQDALTFKILDISVDPLEQGFEPASFDLIICSCVLHATPSLNETMKNVYKLLAPGGHLLMQEIAPEAYFVDAIMGTLPGWWIGENDGRIDKPHVSTERWDEEMRRVGFTGIEALAFDNHHPYHFVANILSRRPPSAPEKSISLLYTGTISEATRTIEKAYLDDGFTVEWLTLADTPSPHVVSLLDLHSPFFDDMNEDAFLAFRKFITDSSLKTLVWVTRHIQRECADPRWSHILGVARTARLELSLPFYTVEMDISEEHAIQSLLAISRKALTPNATTFEPENEYSISGDNVYTCRYHPSKSLSPSDVIESSDGPVRLDVGTYGLIDSLQWVQSPPPCPLRQGEVEIETHYIGVNFRDMMIAMGFIGNRTHFGMEGSGIIRKLGPGPHSEDFRVGDRVWFIAQGGMTTSIVLRDMQCSKIPAGIALDDAATVPAVYSTVVYCLMTVGNLQKGQSVLIHSACGGVGLAAIQLCQALGAEIYATVGTDEKVQYLVDNHGIPQSRIFNSRTPAFKQDVLRVTDGRGVDIVLNSLSGDCLHASWECVAEYGKMIEIGKRDIMGRGKLDLDPFGENRTFVGVDLQKFGTHRPEILKNALEQAFEYIQDGRMKPIEPKMVFEADDIKSAFRHMQTGNHIGKILIRMPRDLSQFPATQTEQPLRFSPDVSYLLVGGVGGLGASISRWMVRNGAKNLVYLSRSAGTSAKCRALISELEAMGCRARAVTGSVANAKDVQKAIASCTKPLAGVFQMAMVLRDQTISKITHEEWTETLAPKVQGTWNLYHELQNQKLDFFVVFGSVVGMCANVGQANYAAANTWVEAFCRYTRRKGFPACGIHLGAVDDVGYVSHSAELLRRCREAFIQTMGENDLLKGVQAAIKHAQFVSCPNDEIDQPSVTVGLQPLTSEMGRATHQNDPRFTAFHIKDTEGASSRGPGMDRINQLIADVEDDVSILDKPSSLELVIQEIGRLVKSEWDENESLESIAETPVDSLMTIEIRSWLRKKVNIDLPTVKITKAGTIGGLAKLVIDEMRVKFTPKDEKKLVTETAE